MIHEKYLVLFLGEVLCFFISYVQILTYGTRSIWMAKNIY